MRFTLSKSEILRGYKSFARVITSGKSISAPPIRCFYTRSSRTSPRILAGFSVSRNMKQAVDRNRAKRLMRESYRLNKYPVIHRCSERDVSFDVVFMYVGLQARSLERMTRKEVDVAMQKILVTITGESEN